MSSGREPPTTEARAGGGNGERSAAGLLWQGFRDRSCHIASCQFPQTGGKTLIGGNPPCPVPPGWCREGSSWLDFTCVDMQPIPGILPATMHGILPPSTL